MKKFIALLLLSLLLQGCGGSNPTKAEQVSQLPEWILQPEQAGYVSAVGSAAPQDFGGVEAQRRVAILKARKQLAEMINVRVKASYESRTVDRNGQITHEQSMRSELRSKVLLSPNQARVIKEWQDPKDNMLYIWLAVPESTFNL